MAVIVPTRHSRVDLAGILLSAVCMLHCALIPVLILAGVGGDLIWPGGRDWTHIIMLGVVVPVSGLALAGGWIRHRRQRVIKLGAIGIGLLAFAAFFAHDYMGHTADAVITTLGGAVLAYAHWQNRHCGCTGNQA
ncbi:MAG: MerC domain-containing protein [Pseudomonadota bacterium]